MTGKQKIKYAADVCMTVMLPLLMSYSLLGDAAHEWLGTVMFLLFVLHHLLNIKWIKNTVKGRYSCFRAVQTVLAAAIFITMAGSMISGIAMSAYVFRQFITGAIPDWAQSVHMICAFWGFILMSLHLGMHWIMILMMFSRKNKKATDERSSNIRDFILRCAAAVITCFGAYAFFKDHIIDHLFMRTHFMIFDPDMTLLRFLAEYACIMGMFVCAGYYISKALKRCR